jgi:hypothetical protein
VVAQPIVVSLGFPSQIYLPIPCVVLMHNIRHYWYKRLVVLGATQFVHSVVHVCLVLVSAVFALVAAAAAHSHLPDMTLAACVAIRYTGRVHSWAVMPGWWHGPPAFLSRCETERDRREWGGTHTLGVG